MKKLLVLILTFTFIILLSGCKQKTDQTTLEEKVEGDINKLETPTQETPTDASALPVYPNATLLSDISERAQQIEQERAASGTSQTPSNLTITVYGSKDSFEDIVKYYINMFGMEPVVLDGVNNPPTGERVAIRQKVPLKENARLMSNLGLQLDVNDAKWAGDVQIVAFMFQKTGHIIIYDRYIHNVTGELINAPLIQKVVINQP
jgi:hypothetical protein